MTIDVIGCLSIILMSCDLSETVVPDTDSSKSSTIQEDSADYIWNESDVIPITLTDKASAIAGTGASISGNVITITQPGTYSLTGMLSNGQVIVNSNDSGLVRLLLKGVNITTATSAPVYIKKATKVIIVLTDHSKNYLTDGSSYVYDNATEEEPNATLFSKENLTIYGNGALTVTGKFNDGISSKDGLIIRGGTLNVTAADDGIRGKDYLYTAGSDITVNSVGDGLKSNKEDDSARGYVIIDSGTFNITSGSNGISAKTNLTINGGTFNITSGKGSNYTISSGASAKGLKGLTSLTIKNGTFNINSADDCLHSNGSLSIANGSMTLSSGDDGMHAPTAITIDDGDITIAKSYEGIESKLITVNTGTINVTASNDAINATAGTTAGGTEQNDGSYLYIKGGTLIASCTNGDAIDSNGNIVMTGGTVLAHGPTSQPEEAVDFNGSFIMNGGFFIGAGPNTNMIKSSSTASSQSNLSIYFSGTSENGDFYGGGSTSGSSLTAGTLFHLQDAGGNNLVTFKPARAYSYILFSSSALKAGSTYSIYTGGSCTGTLSNGLYTGGTYSNGTLKKSVTLSASSTVNTVSL